MCNKDRMTGGLFNNNWTYLAAAIGCGEIVLKRSYTFLPNSLSIVAKAIFESNEGTLSHNFCSSTMLLGLKISGRIESA